VFNGKVIDVTQKKRMSDEKVQARGYERQKDIRNKANGWVFAHENILWDEKLGEIAIAATKAVGLDFCGVDILSRWTKGGRLLEAVVCEVNSAPGMSKTKTFNAYITAIKNVAKRN
jgi:glutathione synthase/RimK-type ligase-like ATP-grasp enzyme